MGERPSYARMNELLSAISDSRVAVVGDFCVDAYWYADMSLSSLSRETPRYPRPVVREAYSPGGAANVAWNLVELGVGWVDAVTIVGQDWRWEIMCELLGNLGVKLEHVISSREWTTTAFVKPILLGYESRQEDARFDFVSDHDLPGHLEAGLLSAMRHVADHVDAVVVCDQVAPGVLTPGGREALSALAQECPKVTFLVDSRAHIGDFQGMVLKPNELEAAQLLLPGRDPSTVTLDELRALAPELVRRTGKPVYVTLGERGVLICDTTGVQHISGIRLAPPLDTVGAGDTFLAAGASAHEAGFAANLAAAVVCKKLNQTGTASPSEILALLAEIEPKRR